MADKAIARRNQVIGDNTRWDALLNEIRTLLPEGANYDDLDKYAKDIQESELKRKDTVENKATSFISSAGIAITVISIIPALFAESWDIPKKWALVSGIAFFVAIILLLVSVYFAIKVRLVKGFALPCADGFKDLLKEGQGKIDERIAIRIASTKWNEDILNQKINYLSVAEDLFLRGLALIAFAVIVSVSGKLLICQ
ncbi:MAG: hypothetical protein PHI97_22360 [Desulfobulbus sp.]|nr:hypothetical protein [Desulfobulbus sp.]